jgi:L-alanine-DL-glutamate epimerase-like enolase superfamily enzyme
MKTAATAVTAGVMGWEQIARATEGKPLIVLDVKIIRVRDRNGGATESYLEIASDSGLKGYAGPLLKEQAAASPTNLRELLVGFDAADPEKLNFNTLWAACHPGKSLESYAKGKDPLTGATMWGIKRTTRQTETGWVITAISAIDLALWDLRGKAVGTPVWRLLGGKRDRLSAYASMLGYSVKPAEARRVAREFSDRGFKRQKWFFMSGPADGAEGLKQNVELARAVREELGAVLFQRIWHKTRVRLSNGLLAGQGQRGLPKL